MLSRNKSDDLIMSNKITPKSVVAFTKMTVALCSCWPLPKGANKLQVIRFKILRFLLCMNVIVVIIPLSYTLYHNDDYDLPTVTKLWFLLAAFLQTTLEIIQCALQYDRLQYLISVMEHNFESTKLNEKMVYQRYIDRCAMFYAGLTASATTSAFLMIIAPLIRADHNFPTDTKYPFDVEYEPMKTIIFLHQALVTCQCLSMVCISTFVGLLIWFAAARFEILSEQLRTVTDIYGIIVCVQEHVKVLRYAQEVIIAFRLVIITIIIICTWAVVSGGLILVTQCTLTDKVQFIVLCLTGLLEVYACAWPADHLIDVSTNIGRAIYESLWYNQDKICQKNVRFIMQRSHIPTTVTVSSILPPLSLQYYASYLSTAFFLFDDVASGIWGRQ